MKPSTFLGNVARFWSRVDTEGECWVWTGEVNGHGYGRFELWHDGGRTRILEHRLSLMLHGVELDDEIKVLHHCDNPPCVRPAHLWLGTQADNMHDAMEKGRLDMSGLALGNPARWSK